MEELKTLWFRDKAYNLEKPSLERMDNDGNYEFSNCEYIENRENSRRGNLGKSLSKETRDKISETRKEHYRRLRNG